jgi:uncharacterized protein (TIGR01244 family)
MDIRHIDATMSVAPQIQPEDVAALRQAGYRTIINNRPDDEDVGQPLGSSIAAACVPEGVRYYEIPVTHAGFSAQQIEAMGYALDEAGGKVLAFCRSGTRSCNLWALTKAKAGDNPEEIIGKGAGAGYNLEGIRPLLDQLSGKA